MKPYSVKLISLTKPTVEGLTTAEELVAYTARVSNPSNQMNNETAPRLLKYLLDNGHFSPFEQVDLGVEIETSRGIAPQILRHWSFSFQEFCVSGDTELYFDFPAALKLGRRKIQKIKARDLFERFKKNPKAYKNAQLRIYDETTGTLSHASLKDAFHTGVKPVFKVTLANGKHITATKEHKFLTKDGWTSLEDAVGLSLIGNTATLSRKAALACNGIPLYQDKETWRERSKGNTLTIEWSQVEKVEYLGEQETYDFEVDHSSHNYVANGIITHNSQRYQEVSDFVKYPARRQDRKNRQNSIDDLPDDVKVWFDQAQQFIWDVAYGRYKQALEMGIAKEQARFLLPLNTKTKLYMKSNLRDWIFYLKLRSGNGTQLEHQEIAKAIIDQIFLPNFPVISEVLGWTKQQDQSTVG